MKVLVYGTGVMGKGISQVLAQKDHYVLLYNPNPKSSNRALETLKKTLNRLTEKGRMTEELKNRCFKKIQIIESLDDAADVDMVIEAVTEDILIKKSIFEILDEIINKDAIFATNTSSLSITELGQMTSRPDKVVGMHFFNPAPIMELIEIIKGVKTSEETIVFIQRLAINLEKTSVLVEEKPGFIVNRMLIPMINEAIAIYSEGIATVEDIDAAMRFGANHPIGPLALADLIGLDVCLSIMDTLHTEIGYDKYAAHTLLRKMVRANKLGRKTKIGFYNYDK